MPAVAKQDPIDAEIGARVHQYLWRNRVPQLHMAGLIQMSGNSLGRKLRGENAWTAGELYRLAQLLQVSVSWLYGETDEEPARPKGLEPLTFWTGVCEHGGPGDDDDDAYFGYPDEDEREFLERHGVDYDADDLAVAA